MNSDELRRGLRVKQINTELEFQRFARVWCDETSDVRGRLQVFRHPSYDQILALGTATIPYVCREMERSPDFRWFNILQSLTGQRPLIPEGDYNLLELTQFWLAWAREHEYC